MKVPTPVITLIVGAALAASLLFSSMTAVSAKKDALAEASASAAASATAAATASAEPAPSASPSPTPARGFVVPPHANYVGKAMGNEGSVALVVHDHFAIAYYCNGSTEEAWLKGTPHDGKLSMKGKDNASLTADYALGHARGRVVVHGTAHIFSIIAVHKPSGLYQSIATVRGASIKAGWIVLADGTQVGSLEPDANSARPSARSAPELDIPSLTARDGDTTLVAKPIDAETGSGF